MKKIFFNFLMCGMCAFQLTGCGRQVEVQNPDDIKLDMQQSVGKENSIVESSLKPTSEPVAETETPTDYYKIATGKTAREVETFARTVKETLLAKDFEKMSELVAYPITIDGERIESQEEFLNMDYGSKVNPKFLKNVEKASYEQMFCNWQGIMLGDIGSVWIAEVLDGDLTSMGLKVIALNDLVDPASES